MLARSDGWRGRARALKAWLRALYLAARDRRVPWTARLVALAVVAYAFSPIDLIPDFIPVLGYLDDLVLLPLGIALAIRLIPREVLEECRAQSELEMAEGRPTSLAGAALVVLVWL
ncbi:MAG TPA: YkvA family protein [Chloroflexota bacterium]|nr:YkvA family protein [Chloroflexota bacterium]